MRELTGRHVLAITVGAFAVIIGVNLTLAWQAVATFPGLEVRNSYVAGQGWDGRRAAQEALGWTATPSYAEGRLQLTVADRDGFPVQLQDLEVLVGRATEAKDDRRPDFVWTGAGYEAATELGRGKWMVKVQGRAGDGTPFEQRLDLMVQG
jgi:nitrogen fixation protein FixH